MKQTISIACFVMTFSITTLGAQAPVQKPAQQQPQPQQGASQTQLPEDFDSTPYVLQTFGGMLGNFLGIVSNPEDPQNVVERVGDMIQGMINIHTIGMRSFSTEPDRIYAQLERELTAYLLTEEGQMFLEHWRNTIANKSVSFATV